MKRILLLIHIFLFATSALLFSQTENQQERKTTRQLTKWEKKFATERYGDNIYKTGSNWLTAGVGLGYHTNKEVLNRNIALTYHHRFRGVYFNAGAQYNGPIGDKRFHTKYRIMEKLTDFHIGAGLRFEDRYFHFAFFIGPSLAITSIPKEENKNLFVKNKSLGAVTQLQFTFKYLYDLGIGTTLFGSFNKRYQVIGLQLHFYFSNAFKMKY